MGQSSVLISNLVGPVESMSLGNHPVNGFYFTGTGGSDVCIVSIYLFYVWIDGEFDNIASILLLYIISN
jgi:hypothetical protein